MGKCSKKTKKTFVIRRTTEGWDRASSSYVVERSQPVNKSIGGGYRFAKTSLSEAVQFEQTTAKKILTSLKRNDSHKGESTYTLIEA